MGGGWKRKVGEDLRSQDVTVQVPSALVGLTAGFEKGPGVPPPHNTPTKSRPDHTPPAKLTKRMRNGCVTASIDNETEQDAADYRGQLRRTASA